MRGVKNPNPYCSIDGCDRPPSGRGWCHMHYLRWWKYGDPLTAMRDWGAGVLAHGHATGDRDSPTYVSWRGMWERCTNPNAVNYARYGGRGITVDPRWSSFEGFLADMGERPESMTIDRIDPDGDYEPDNCRWADASTQRRNRSKL